jgi:hypothetical protein
MGPITTLPQRHSSADRSKEMGAQCATGLRSVFENHPRPMGSIWKAACRLVESKRQQHQAALSASQAEAALSSLENWTRFLPILVPPPATASACLASRAAITSRPRVVAMLCVGLTRRLKRMSPRAFRDRRMRSSTTWIGRRPPACSSKMAAIAGVSPAPSILTC